MMALALFFSDQLWRNNSVIVIIIPNREDAVKTKAGCSENFAFKVKNIFGTLSASNNRWTTDELLCTHWTVQLCAISCEWARLFSRLYWIQQRKLLKPMQKLGIIGMILRLQIWFCQRCFMRILIWSGQSPHPDPKPSVQEKYTDLNNFGAWICTIISIFTTGTNTISRRNHHI